VAISRSLTDDEAGFGHLSKNTASRLSSRCLT
jgi:hypothetical protein